LAITNHWIARECWSQEEYETAHIESIQSIQLDAFKAGMEYAATIAASGETPDKYANIGMQMCAEAIRDAEKKLMEIPT